MLMARADEGSVEALETAFKGVLGILGASSAPSGVIAWMMAATTRYQGPSGLKAVQGAPTNASVRPRAVM